MHVTFMYHIYKRNLKVRQDNIMMLHLFFASNTLLTGSLNMNIFLGKVQCILVPNWITLGIMVTDQISQIMAFL